MRMSQKRIEDQAAELIEAAQAFEIPVSLNRVAKHLNVHIKPAELGSSISGILVIGDSGGTIGYNPSEPDVRQRFSIAHELGHFFLHRNDMPLFVDRKYSVAFRDQNSSTGDLRHEREANAFAAALLMPEEQVRNAFEESGFDLGGDEESLRALAARFEVSTQAMTYRLANLGILDMG